MTAKLFPAWMNFDALIPFKPVRIQSIKSSCYSIPVFPQYIVFQLRVAAYHCMNKFATILKNFLSFL